MIKDLKWIGIGIMLALFILAVSNNLNQNDFQLASLFSNGFLHENKVITIGRTTNSIGLDPAVLTDEESFRVTVNIYNNLVCYGQDGMNIEPSLAESWTVSEDGLIWHFNIRKNVLFHDGTKLDADAIVFNFNRWMDSSNPYHAGHFIYWNMNFGGIPGIIESVRSLSSDTVEIVLRKPYAPFLSTLAIPAYAIASPDAIMKYNEDLKNKPVGTGPFIFKSWDENGDIVLERNNNYWDEKAKVDQLVFKTIPDSDERIKLMRSGEILIADNLTTKEISNIKETDDLILVNRSYFNIGYLAMNMNNKNLKIKNVRKAISCLIDQNEMIETAYENSARAANTFVPPVLWGYNETIKSTPQNPEKAIELLKSVNKGNGIDLKLLVMEEARTYFPKPQELAKYIKKALSEANIHVIVEILPWEEVLKRGHNGDYDMILAGWNGDVADPDNFLYTFFSSENIKEGVISNYSYYSNSQVDSLLTLARQATDKSFRNSLYREIQEMIFNDTPAIPLAHTIPILGINKRVIGYTTNISGIEPLNRVNLAKEP
ncbi:ABC transporter substrate-binding protein [Fusibacter bizertensis]